MVTTLNWLHPAGVSGLQKRLADVVAAMLEKLALAIFMTQFGEKEMIPGIASHIVSDFRRKKPDCARLPPIQGDAWR
jgi:hypothetical protein